MTEIANIIDRRFNNRFPFFCFVFELLQNESPDIQIFKKIINLYLLFINKEVGYTVGLKNKKLERKFHVLSSIILQRCNRLKTFVTYDDGTNAIETNTIRTRTI